MEESDASVTLAGAWAQADPLYGWSGGKAMQSATADATATFTFTGTSVRWIGRRSRDSGIALVSIDGGRPRRVDLFSRTREMRTPVITIYDLRPGQHTLTIQVTGTKHPDSDSSAIVVDAFEVEPQILSHYQESDPDATYSGAWEDDKSRFRWSGCCVRTSNEPEAVGGARLTEAAGAKVTFKFRGTSIAFISYRGPDAGIASVQVDGGEAVDIDLYAPEPKVQEVVFSKAGLADANHTLTVTATGQKNAAATAANVVVDAFDVTVPGRRFEEHNQYHDPARGQIVYSGTWEHRTSRVWSEGGAAASPVAGSRATFSFTGTSVSWIGAVKASLGSARIYLDGALVTDRALVTGAPLDRNGVVNLRRSVPVEGYQRTIFRVNGLTNGPHTLTIEAVNDGPYIVVDAFDVHP